MTERLTESEKRIQAQTEYIESRYYTSAELLLDPLRLDTPMVVSFLDLRSLLATIRRLRHRSYAMYLQSDKYRTLWQEAQEEGDGNFVYAIRLMQERDQYKSRAHILFHRLLIYKREARFYKYMTNEGTKLGLYWKEIAETKNTCGHPMACVVTSNGTSYCAWCEEVAALKLAITTHEVELAKKLTG